MSISELWINDQNKIGEQLLPDLTSFTSKQLFWIQGAQLWCSRYSDEMLIDSLKNSPYPPGGFRNNGSVMFSGEFANDFNCPIGSPMNPSIVCPDGSIWPKISSTKNSGKRR